MFRLSTPADSEVEGQIRCPKCRKCEIKYIFLVLVTAPRSRFRGGFRPLAATARWTTAAFMLNGSLGMSTLECPRLIGCPTVTKTGLDCQVVLAEITGTTLHAGGSRAAVAA